MKLADFTFTLPEDLIAQRPAPRRDDARMMVVHRSGGQREHRHFRDLPDILGPEHFLVINESRVFPARLRARRPDKYPNQYKEEIEILLLREESPGRWLALTRPGKKTQVGQQLRVGNPETGELSATVTDIKADGSRLLQFDCQENLFAVFEKIGEPPTPPYIRREHASAEDRERYQTVYARQNGSIAAPTAGLHFTDEVFQRLDRNGIAVCRVCLHVGYGTFKPVRAENIEEHRMESEYYRIDADTAARITALKAEGRRLVAVGTTSTRCLEYLARQPRPFAGAAAGACNLFIYPGFEFKMLDGLITNFHLPGSTLVMLAAAFAGRELLLDCYREAISLGYRFYSYGDCMLIL